MMSVRKGLLVQPAYRLPSADRCSMWLGHRASGLLVRECLRLNSFFLWIVPVIIAFHVHGLRSCRLAIIHVLMP